MGGLKKKKEEEKKSIIIIIYSNSNNNKNIIKMTTTNPIPILHLETKAKRNNENLAKYRFWYDREVSYSTSCLTVVESLLGETRAG